MKKFVVIEEIFILVNFSTTKRTFVIFLDDDALYPSPPKFTSGGRSPIPESRLWSGRTRQPSTLSLAPCAFGNKQFEARFFKGLNIFIHNHSLSSRPRLRAVTLTKKMEATTTESDALAHELADFASALKERKRKSASKKESKDAKETPFSPMTIKDQTKSSIAPSNPKTNEAESLPTAGRERYQALLGRLYAVLRENNPDIFGDKATPVLPPPQVMRVGTSRVLWTNFPEICSRMKREPEHVFRFFLAEFGTTGSIDGSQRFLLKGKFTPKSFQTLLKKYIAQYVTCNSCKGVETGLVKDPHTRLYVVNCASCGAHRSVVTIQRGYQPTAKGERKALRNAEA